MNRSSFFLLLGVLLFVSPQFLFLQSFASSPALAVTNLATGQTEPSNLFVYQGYVYWNSYNNFPIDRVPIAGGSVSPVLATCNSPASQCVLSFVVNGNYVYYNNASGIYRVSVTGGASKLIVACLCLANFRIFSSSIYYVQFTQNSRGADKSTSINKVSINGGPSTVLYKVPSGINIVEIAIYKSYIYWFDHLTGIGRVPLTGGAGKILYSSSTCVNDLWYTQSPMIIANGFIYLAISCGTGMAFPNSSGVYKISINGGALTTLFTASGGAGSGNVVPDLTYNSGNILFSYTVIFGGGYGIYSVPSTGGSATLLVSSNQPVSIVVSSGKAYYTDWTSGDVNTFTP